MNRLIVKPTVHHSAAPLRQTGRMGRTGMHATVALMAPDTPGHARLTVWSRSGVRRMSDDRHQIVDDHPRCLELFPRRRNAPAQDAEHAGKAWSGAAGMAQPPMICGYHHVNRV